MKGRGGFWATRAVETLRDPRSPLRWLHEHYVTGPQLVVDPSRDPGDIGWVGPGGVSWRLFGDPSSVIGVFVAMLMQAGSPVIADAFQSFSDYQANPKKRFWLTGGFYFAVTYGSCGEAEEWITRARQGHRRISGAGLDGVRVPIAHPDVIRYSHLTVIDATIRAWDAFGPEDAPLSLEDRDRFCEEQSWAAVALGARNVPTNYEDLRLALAEPLSQPRWSDAGQASFDSIMTGAGLAPPARAIYRALVDGAKEVLPVEHKEAFGVHGDSAAAITRGRAMAAGTRALVPHLSCQARAEKRIASGPNAARNTSFRLTSASLAAGRQAWANLEGSAQREEAAAGLAAWWDRSATRSELSSATVLALRNNHLLDADGSLTAEGFFAAAALQLDLAETEKVVREAKVLARRLATYPLY